MYIFSYENIPTVLKMSLSEIVMSFYIPKKVLFIQMETFFYKNMLTYYMW